MATFSIDLAPDLYYPGLDIPAAWDLTAFGKTAMVFEAGDFRLELTGTGFAGGESPAGTITGAKLYHLDLGADTPVETLVLASTSALSLSMAGLAGAIDSTTFTFAALPYLLKGSDTLTGTAGDDRINGYGGSDKISGGDGNDVLYGDRYIYDETQGNDKLSGGAGDDTLIGHGGSDTMTGGTGNDLYGVTEAGDVVVEAVGGGTHDRVQFSNETGLMSYTLAENVENLEVQHFRPETLAVLRADGNALANKIVATADHGAASGNEAFYGLAGNDRLFTGDGNDLLDGGTGRDTMIGGAGSDTYHVDNRLDVVRESIQFGSGDGSIDTVVLGISTATVASLGSVVTGHTNGVVYSGIETLTLGSSASKQAHVAIGNGLANTLNGNGGANKLYGLGGADVLKGGAGNDLLQGGLGTDTMSGGSGSDRFVFLLASESSSGSTRDVINGFASGDLIDVSAIDANGSASGSPAFSYIGSDDFSAAGQLRLDDGVLYGSTDADTTAEFSVALTGVTSLTAADFVL